MSNGGDRGRGLVKHQEDQEHQEDKLGFEYQGEGFMSDVIFADDMTVEQTFTIEEEERVHDIMRELMQEIGIQAAPFKPVQYQEVAEHEVGHPDLTFFEEFSNRSAAANKLLTSETNIISAESSSPDHGLQALPDQDDHLWQLDEWNFDQDISFFTEIDDEWMLGISVDSKNWSVDEQRAW